MPRLNLSGLLLCFCFAVSSMCSAQNLSPLKALTAPKKFAICIGASNYQQIGKLQFASKDAIDFANTLIEQFGYQKSETKILVDEPGYTPPTSENLKKVFADLAVSKEIESGDQVIIYFSGHGIGLPSGDYWLPTDVSPQTYEKLGISLRTVIENLSNRKILNLLVVADACRAGAKTQNFGTELITLGRRTNISILLGCQPGQKSYELTRRKNGAFTYSLVKSLKNTKLIDTGSGALWASKIGESTAQLTTEFTKPEYGENAQYPAIFTDKSQDVPIAIYPSSSKNLKEIEASLPPDLSVAQTCLFLGYKGIEFTEAANYKEARSCFLTVESLGQLGGAYALSYYSVLSKLGLLSEWNRIVNRNYVGKPLTKRGAIAICLAEPSVVGETQYSKALDHLEDAFDTVFDEISIRYEFAKKLQTNSKARSISLIKSFLTRAPKNDPRILPWKAILKLEQGDTQSAITDLELLKSTESELIYESLADAYLVQQNATKLLEICKLAVSKYPNNPKFTYMQLPVLIAQEKGKEASKLLVDYLKKNGYAGWMDFFVAQLAGDVAPILTAGEELLKEIPDHVELNIWGWMKACIIAQDFTLEFNDIIKSGIQKDAVASFKPFQLVMDWLVACSRAEEFTLKQAEKAHRELSSSMLASLPTFYDSPQSTQQFHQQLFRSGFHIQAYYFALNDWPTRHPEIKNEPVYLKCLFLASLAVGELETAQNTWAQYSEIQPPDSEMCHRYIAHLALMGQDQEVKELLKKRKELANDPYSIGAIALGILATKGAKEANEYMIKNNKPEVRAERGAQILGMTAFFLANPEIIPLDLVKTFLKADPTNLDIQLLCAERIVPELLKSKSPDIQKSGRLLMETLYAYSGNRIVEKSKLFSTDTIENFVGDYTFELIPMPGIKYKPTKIEFSVLPSGAVAGKFQGYDVKGKLDSTGNLELRIIVKGVESTLILAKLPPKIKLSDNNNIATRNLKFIFLANNCLLLEYHGKLVAKP